MRKRLFLGILCCFLAGCLQKSKGAFFQSKGEKLFLKHCASCHHPQRIGLIGPPLLPSFLARKKDGQMFKIISRGLPSTQMTGFPQLSKKEIQRIIKHLRTPGAVQWTIEDIQRSLSVEKKKAPSSYSIGEITNLTAVVERGKQQVWVMENQTVLDRFSFSNVHGGIKFNPQGTAFFVPSRDGWIGRYDLKRKGFWGKIRSCVYLRNLAISPDGKYLIAASWLPKGLIILDAQKLTPLKILPVSGKISAIYSFTHQNKAIFTFRDLPSLGILDTKTFEIAYSKLEEPIEDFFIDPRDQFLVGSFRKGKLLRVLNLTNQEVVFEHPTPGMPHLFSVAFWYQDNHFYFATPHMKKPILTVWKMYQWAFVKSIDIGGDGFFVRPHSETPYLWVDNGSDELVLVDKKDLTLQKKVVIKGQKVLHTEFSGDGKIAYVSLFSQKGHLVLLDGATLEELKKIPSSLPVGKYNFRNKQRRYFLGGLGKEVFMAKCWGCHHPTEKAFGPSFQWIIQHRHPSWIQAQLLNPEITAIHLGYKRNAMPKISLTAEEIESLLAFMKEQKKEKGPLLRITEYIRDTLNQKAYRPFLGTILIWNLTNGCNLSCAHCYASAKKKSDQELSTAEALGLVPSLEKCRVKVAILSGGEPLMRRDLFEIAHSLKERKILPSLSTNGLLITEKNLPQIQNHFSYVGISIDGNEESHDLFRGKKGAYQKSLEAIRLCLSAGIKVGIRFTLTLDTYPHLPFVFDLAEKEGIPKIYISHLVYAGRGGDLMSLDSSDSKKALEFILAKSFEYVEKEKGIDVVTGNNEVDSVMLYKYFQKKYPPLASRLYHRLENWGGNQAGSRLLNIDCRGNVKADPFMPELLGNIRERTLEEIWNQKGILTQLRDHPRKIQGKCQSCSFLSICNGNSRARSYALFGDYWREDPSCYI